MIGAVEQTQYTDAETGRKVTLWTAPGRGHNVGLYYHQNPFDARRNLVYFVSDRTGSWQLWRAHLDDGRLEQVSDLPRMGQVDVGEAEASWHAANYCYVSSLSGLVYLPLFGGLAVIDPDTLACRTILDGTIPADVRDRRWAANFYAFPSSDETKYRGDIYNSSSLTWYHRLNSYCLIAKEQSLGIYFMDSIPVCLSDFMSQLRDINSGTADKDIHFT